jgi:hypothetical protein
MFASIPHAMWWGIVTIATVGYGDMAPVTLWGKLWAGVVLLVGIALFAVPAGILANGFAVELKKREFIVTWRLIAKLPLFADLAAAVIASVSRLLQPRAMPKDSIIVRKGEPGHAMYFVLNGQAEVHVEPQKVRLGPGTYFGEIALLMDVPRKATVVAATDCELLELGSVDFQRVCRMYFEQRRGGLPRNRSDAHCRTLHNLTCFGLDIGAIRLRESDLDFPGLSAARRWNSHSDCGTNVHQHGPRRTVLSIDADREWSPKWGHLRERLHFGPKRPCQLFFHHVDE